MQEEHQLTEVGLKRIEAVAYRLSIPSLTYKSRDVRALPFAGQYRSN